eukprot:Em0003g1840a
MIGSSRVCEESQELLEIDDEEFNQKKTVVEETDLEDGDVDVNNMEVVQRNKWTKMYSKQKAKGVQHPSYKYLVTIRKKEDREKLDAKPCHDCEKGRLFTRNPNLASVHTREQISTRSLKGAAPPWVNPGRSAPHKTSYIEEQLQWKHVPKMSH